MKKILWYSLSPCGSLRRNNQARYTQTWMTTLEDELKRNTDIQLHVAFFASKDEGPFEYEGVNYHPMPIVQHNLWEKIKYKYGNPKDVIEQQKELCLNVFYDVMPDLIHIHGTESMFGLIAPLVGDTPIVYSIQGILSSIAEKYYSGFDRKEASNADSFKEILYHRTNFQIYRNFKNRASMEQSFLSSAKYIFGRTDLDKNITGLFNPERQYFVVNEIMRQEFLNNEWKELNGTKFKIVSVLSAGIYKGYPTLLKAAELLSKYAKFDYEWNVIGCDINSKYVRAAIKKTGIDISASKLHFLGSQTADVIVDQELNSSLYVHTGQTENSPNTVCEAMCLGMPIIATFAGGTTSIIEHKEEGFLVQDGDAYALAGAIVDIHDNYKSAVACGKKAREKALLRHSPSAVVEELIAAYNIIMQ